MVIRMHIKSVKAARLDQEHAGCREKVGDIMDNKLKRFLAIAATVTVLNGISYALVPNALLPVYGVEPSAGAVLGFRFVGAALLTFGLTLWFVRESQDWTALRGVLLGAAVGNVVGIVVSLWAIQTGIMNGAGWLFVLTYVIFLLGYVYFLRAGAQKPAVG
jgi:FtsH-binding integral membrane protein